MYKHPDVHSLTCQALASWHRQVQSWPDAALTSLRVHHRDDKVPERELALCLLLGSVESSSL